MLREKENFSTISELQPTSHVDKAEIRKIIFFSQLISEENEPQSKFNLTSSKRNFPFAK